MLYDLEQGKVEGKIIEQCMREGLPLPDRIANAPILLDGLDLYYSGYRDLMYDRPMDGSISWSTIHRYSVDLELGEEQREAMHYHIREMDNAYLGSRKG